MIRCSESRLPHRLVPSDTLLACQLKTYRRERGLEEVAEDGARIIIPCVLINSLRFTLSRHKNYVIKFAAFNVFVKPFKGESV